MVGERSAHHQVGLPRSNASFRGGVRVRSGWDGLRVPEAAWPSQDWSPVRAGKAVSLLPGRRHAGRGQRECGRHWSLAARARRGATAWALPTTAEPSDSAERSRSTSSAAEAALSGVSARRAAPPILQVECLGAEFVHGMPSKAFVRTRRRSVSRKARDGRVSPTVGIRPPRMGAVPVDGYREGHVGGSGSSGPCVTRPVQGGSIHSPTVSCVSGGTTSHREGRGLTGRSRRQSLPREFVRLARRHAAGLDRPAHALLQMSRRWRAVISNWRGVVKYSSERKAAKLNREGEAVRCSAVQISRHRTRRRRQEQPIELPQLWQR